MTVALWSTSQLQCSVSLQDWLRVFLSFTTDFIPRYSARKTNPNCIVKCPDESCLQMMHSKVATLKVKHWCFFERDFYLFSLLWFWVMLVVAFESERFKLIDNLRTNGCQNFKLKMWILTIKIHTFQQTFWWPFAHINSISRVARPSPRPTTSGFRWWPFSLLSWNMCALFCS